MEALTDCEGGAGGSFCPEVERSDAERADVSGSSESKPPCNATCRTSFHISCERYLWNRSRQHQVARTGVCVVLVALWGVLAGFWTPRGPLTSGQAIASLILSLVLGDLIGFVLTSKWTLAWATVVFLAMLELMHVRVSGPTVDKVHLKGTTYGLVAFVSGRCVHYVLTLVPMVLGWVYGVLTRRWVLYEKEHNEGSKNTPGRLCRAKIWARRCTGWLLLLAPSIVIIILFVVLLIPARTEGIANENGVAELTSTAINGKDLALMIRGVDAVANPVLLFLAGGPGGSELGAMRNHLESLEDYFTVVTWDQRGCGKSYSALDPTDSVSLEGYVSDTIVLTDHLRERFQKERIYLLGNSWGSLLAVLTLDHDTVGRYAAYIGTGQMVSPRATDILIYEDTLAWAESNAKVSLADSLRSRGPPPYKNILDYEDVLTNTEEVFPYDHSNNAEGENGFSENVGAEEYNLIERLHIYGALIDTYSTLYPKIQHVDFRPTSTTQNSTEVTKFTVPLFFVQGAHEVPGRAQVFEEWYPTISAPHTEVVVFDTSGHRPLFEQPDQFVEFMVHTVLNLTS